MSMTKEQFLGLIEKRYPYDPAAKHVAMALGRYIWGELLTEGNHSMKVKEYYEFMTPEEKADLARLRAKVEDARRTATREFTIERQMDRTGCTREQAERMLP